MSNYKIHSQAGSGTEFIEPLIFEKGSSGRCGIDFDDDDYDDIISTEDVKLMLNSHCKKSELLLPYCSEPEVCIHFTRLSQKNFCIDTNSYPLGSCTMKYNPKINEWAARLTGFTSLHPYMPEVNIQGALSIIYDLQIWLNEIGGFFETSFQPSAGAQGEFSGILMILAALRKRKEKRCKILIPKSAHGTNPATAGFFNLKVVSINSDLNGFIDINDIKKKMDRKTVGIMITNPNTLGIFEKNIIEISKIIHKYGGFVYGDGANLNALMGIVKPADLGIDIMHFNLHKTFTTPHGGGGPGAGAVGASKNLAEFLPSPLVNLKNNKYYFDYKRPLSIGRIRSFYGNFGMMVRAWTYIREMGYNGLKKASELAVLNANYVKAKLKSNYNLPYISDCLHEVVFDDKIQQLNDISTIDIAKRLIDYGIHPPTIYFPLIVSGALMIEPTESESKESLDKMCDAFISIAIESIENPKIIKSAPNNTLLSRLDEVYAIKKPILKWMSK